MLGKTTGAIVEVALLLAGGGGAWGCEGRGGATAVTRRVTAVSVMAVL